MKKLKLLLTLFVTMFKIGLFTFGGGYAMIAIIEREIIERKKWIGNDEFLDIIAIAESTPGPLAINSATFVGYKIAGVLGSVFATLGVVLPSFIIIYIISLFFDAFLSIVWVGYAFRGIQVAVAFLIFNAGIKMLKKLKKTAHFETILE
jgi:chromate transporter